MSIRPNLLSAAVLAALPLLAQAGEEALHQADTVVVTATRQPARADEITSSVEVIGRERIEAAGARSLPDLLSSVTGLRIASNGGAGANSSAFIRGAESRHTLLMIDGMRVGSATTGQPTLETIPLEMIERIEILRGPASALYGSEAIGGVIQIFTRKGLKGFQPEVFAGYGSDDTRKLSASLLGGGEKFRYAVSAGHDQSDGINSNPDPVKQPNYYQPDRDAYRNSHFSARFTANPGEHDELGANLWLVDGRNHYDAYGTDYDAYLDKRQTVLGAHYTRVMTDLWISTLRFGHSEDKLKDYSWDGEPGEFNTRQQQFMWQNDLRLPVGRLMLAYEHLQQEVDGSTDYVEDSRDINSFLLGWNATVAQRHLLQVNVRHDDNSQFGGKTTGHLGYGYLISEAWRVQASVASAYNAPTFNQLYWPDTGFGGGNPDLKPEKALNREIGLRYEQGDYSASLTYFNNRVKDMIAGWPPANVNEARLEGLELASAGSFMGYRVEAGLDLLDAEDEKTGKELPRRADVAGFVRLSREQGNWRWGADWNGQGDRWDNLTNTRHMGGYGLLNAFVHYRVSPEWRVELNADNLLDKQYETVWGFGTPGLNLFAGVRYTPR